MITINGNAIQLTAPCTVETLLVERGYSLQRIAGSSSAPSALLCAFTATASRAHRSTKQTERRLREPAQTMRSGVMGKKITRS